MKGQEFLEKLLKSYREAYDITSPCDIHGDRYDAYAVFHVTSAKYVLVKKAELWRADCHEHTVFSVRESLTGEELKHLEQEIREYMEPVLVRGNQPCMEQDHMYTYITAVIICEQGISKEVKKAAARFRFFKNYRFGIRGYCEARLLIFDMENRKVYGNRAARELIKGYRKVF